MEMVFFSRAIQRRHKGGFRSCRRVHNWLYFSELKPTMKNQPLHGGEAQYFKALDATKATGCGFQTMVTNHRGDARGRKGVHICWKAHSLAFIQDGNKQKKKLSFTDTACQKLAALKKK